MIRYCVYYPMLIRSIPDHHVGYEEPKTFVDYVKPEYWYGKLTEQEKPEKKS